VTGYMVFAIVAPLIWLWWNWQRQVKRMDNLSGYNDPLNAEMGRVWCVVKELEKELQEGSHGRRR
jgi:hypothetical protein